MKWNIQEPVLNWDLDELGISGTLGKLLVNRGLTQKHAKLLLTNPLALFENPYGIINAEKAADAIIKQMREKKPIFVFADYDVDGMTSGYVITNFLRDFGGDVTPYYPERHEHYGLSVKFATRLIKEHQDKNPIVITVDNGITAIEPINILKSAGIETIVLDHHEPGEELPDCICCNPWVNRKVGTHLAGVGVTWKVCQIIEHKAEQLAGRTLNTAIKYAPFVGLGTIADVMPMEIENRAIVKLALDKINNKESKVFNAMMKIYDLSNEYSPITAKDIAWQIAPKLNSCSRLGNTQLPAGAFYLTESEEIENTVIDIAKLDQKRKSLTKKATKDAIENVDYSNDAVCFFDASAYPAGIAGIIAGKLSEEFQKPAVVYTVPEGSDVATASCRSMTLDIKMLLSMEADKGLLNYVAGHGQACGAELFVSKIPELKKDLKRTVGELIIKGEIEESEPTLTIDTVLTIPEITNSLVEEMKQVPYGSNEEPTFSVHNVKATLIEPFANKEHLVLELMDDRGNQLYAIGWGMKYVYEEKGSPAIIDIAGTLEYAKYSARSLDVKYNTVILMIKDLRKAG